MRTLDLLLRSSVPLCLGLSALAPPLAGCSWLYDEEQLPDFIPPEGPIPGPIPDAITLEQVSPAELIEGYGDGGSRPTLLVLQGREFSTETTVEITDDEGQPVPGVSLAGPISFDAYHTHLAVAVAVAAGPDLAPGTRTLKVQVTKPDGAGGTVSAHLPWTLRGLPEIDTPGVVNSDSNAQLYSRVNVEGTVSVEGTGRPLVIRSTSTLRITGGFSLSSTNRTAGKAGGAEGGAAGAAGNGRSGGLGGNGNDGGGGGFATQGFGGPNAAPPVGDALITSYAKNLSSGGGGGGLPLVNPLGAVGGGSGGIIELSARGELSVGDISSNGGKGATGLLGLGDGGGGTGGVIVVRSGVKAKVGMLSALAGLGGDGDGDTNRGSVGRIRIDTPALESKEIKPAARRGSVFDPETPLVVDRDRIALRLVGSAGSQFDIRRLNGADQPLIDETVLADFQGSDTLTVQVPLINGFNRLCTTPVGEGSVSLTESTTCIDVAYLKPVPPLSPR